MATNGAQSQQTAGNAAARAVLAKEASARRRDSSSDPSPDSPRKVAGYGLPCAKCHLYFPADLDVCPTCKHNERVSPMVSRVPIRAAQSAAETVPDTSVVEQ